MGKVVLRVKPVAELPAGEPTEVELACFERDEQVGLADLGLSLAEAKQLTAALQAAMVRDRAIVQRTKIADSLGGTLKKLSVSMPKQILSVSAPVADPAAT